jgi:hypothetical protein
MGSFGQGEEYLDDLVQGLASEEADCQEVEGGERGVVEVQFVRGTSARGLYERDAVLMQC